MDNTKRSSAGTPMSEGHAREAMPPTPAELDDPDYLDHGDGSHSHKHDHDDFGEHRHRHHHEAGDQPHTHGADDPIHAEHIDHRRQHVGG